MIARVRTGTGREVLDTGRVVIGIRANEFKPTQPATETATLIQDALLAPDSHVIGGSFSGSRRVTRKIAAKPKTSLHRLGRGPIATMLRKLRWALLRMRGPL